MRGVVVSTPMLNNCNFTIVKHVKYYPKESFLKKFTHRPKLKIIIFMSKFVVIGNVLIFLILQNTLKFKSGNKNTKKKVVITDLKSP